MIVSKSIGGGYAAPRVEVIEISTQSMFAMSYGDPGKTGNVHYDDGYDDLDF